MGGFVLYGSPEVPVSAGSEFGFSQNEDVRLMVDDCNVDSGPVGPNSPAVESANPDVGAGGGRGSVGGGERRGVSVLVGRRGSTGCPVWAW